MWIPRVLAEIFLCAVSAPTSDEFTRITPLEADPKHAPRGVSTDKPGPIEKGRDPSTLPLIRHDTVAEIF
jgi:hypothetical protein